MNEIKYLDEVVYTAEKEALKSDRSRGAAAGGGGGGGGGLGHFTQCGNPQSHLKGQEVRWNVRETSKR